MGQVMCDQPLFVILQTAVTHSAPFEDLNMAPPPFPQPGDHCLQPS